MGFFRKILIKLGWLSEKGIDPPPPLELLSRFPTLEVFGQPGHGKSSYLWSVFYMLRKLNLVWPDYLCWPQDDATEEALKAIHENVHEGRLPPRGAEGNELRYDLRLQNMERWGEKKLVVWDWPDPVFSPPDSNGARKETVNWGAPAWWLISLPDLRDVQVEYLDMFFDDLVRKRISQGYPVYSRPLRLVVVLTKGDAIPDLPLPIRDYLKQDPLWKAVSAEDFGASPLLGAEPLRAYLATLSNAHAMIQQWLNSTLHGHMLLRRAAEYHVDLRFAIVSATGSGFVESGKLQFPWTPRRVLDPLFWAMEFESAPLR
jgi:hypothetical protein